MIFLNPNFAVVKFREEFGFKIDFDSLSKCLRVLLTRDSGKLLCGVFVVLGILLAQIHWAWAKDPSWGMVKDKHFIVYYESSADESLAENVLRMAENYYRKIGDDIGYSRINKMWTWEDRVQIFIFKDQDSFSKNTGQPFWSTGYANRDSRLFKSRTIVTYRQEKDFVDGLLPHEISHLILHDFIGQNGIPVWFDEGIAQLQEKNKSPVARQAMRILYSRGQLIPLNQLMNQNIRQEKDALRVEIFYAQSLSVVEFLLAFHGREAFGKLCRALRDGKSFEQGLSASYPGVFKTISDLERKWLLFIKQ